MSRRSAPTRQTSNRSTRHHRVDEEFLDILHEDFGIPKFSLVRAFDGVPPAPKKQAIAICEWALKKAGGDPDAAADRLRGWAKRRKVGRYHPNLVGAPPLTFGGKTGFELEGV